MGEHLVEVKGKILFKSDKYDWSPAGYVPFSLTDRMAQPFLWEYAEIRRAVDSEFADDLQEALAIVGYCPTGDLREECTLLYLEGLLESDGLPTIQDGLTEEYAPSC